MFRTSIQVTLGSLHGEPCITPGQKMGALPGSSARGFGYRDTAGLKYIPAAAAAAAAAVVARPFILGKPDSSCPAVVMGRPRMSLIPCGVLPGIWEQRLDSDGALNPPGLCCSAYGKRDVFISVMLCNAASGVLPRTKALCRKKGAAVVFRSPVTAVQKYPGCWRRRLWEEGGKSGVKTNFSLGEVKSELKLSPNVSSCLLSSVSAGKVLSLQ